MKSITGKKGCEIDRSAGRGEDVSPFFTNAGRMVGPIQRVNVDFTAGMLRELDDEAEGTEHQPPSVIKTLVRQGLDRHYWSKARSLKANQS
jgi:hypothetical protein